MSTSIISIHPDNETNVDIICNDILSEYELSPSEQKILSSKLKAHIVSMINAQKNLSNEAKESIQRLYHNDLIHKQKQKIKNEQLQICNEKKEATFSPKINTYSKNLCSNGRSRNNHYSKNQKYKTQIQLQRIINKVNEINVYNKGIKHSITNENNNESDNVLYGIQPSKDKFNEQEKPETTKTIENEIISKSPINSDTLFKSSQELLQKNKVFQMEYFFVLY